MDTRPIGIFDSGLGGLTAVGALVQAAPWESFVYFGDTANAPYGDKTRSELAELSGHNIRFLRSRHVKAVLVACNTSTANAMDAMTGEARGLPVVGVIRAAAQAAAPVTKTGRIAVLATAATVRSGAYERAIHALLPEAEVTAVACPRLVPLIEGGHTDPADPALRSAAEEYAAPVRANRADTVILGCTHYPIVRGAIEAALEPGTALVDSGAASVGTLLAALEARDALGDRKSAGTRQFFCSARREAFARHGTAFLGWPVENVTEIDIRKY